MAEPTFNELMDAVKRARDAGDHEAALSLRQDAVKAQQREDRARYAPDAPEDWSQAKGGVGGILKRVAAATNPMFNPAFRANWGAGAHKFAQGVGQLTGRVSAEDVAEANKVREQLAESTPGGKLIQFAAEAAPTVAIPGGPVRGAWSAARVGAQQGALSGLTSATENPDVAMGKAQNTVLNAAGGAVLAPVAVRAIPGAVDWVRRNFNPRFGAQRAIERALEETGEEAGTVAGNLARNRARTDIDPNRLPTAALAESEALRRVAGTIDEHGGTPAAIMEREAARNNAARVAEVDRTIGTTQGAATAAAQARNAATTHYQGAAGPIAPGTKPQATFIESLIDNLSREAAEKGNTAAAKTLADMSTKWHGYARAARKSGDWSELYKFRKEGIDDLVNQLAGSEKNTAEALRRQIEKEIRPELDKFLDYASRGQSRQFIGRGSPGQQLLTEAEQREAANRLRQTIDAPGPRTQLGDPDILRSGVQSEVQKIINEPLNEFGTQKLSPEVMNTVERMRREADLLRSARGAEGFRRGEGGFAGPGSMVTRGTSPQMVTGPNTAAAAAFFMGNSPLAATMYGLNGVMNWGAARGSQELARMMANPQYAQQVLQEAARRGLKAQQLAPLVEIITKGAGAAGAPTDLFN